MLYNYSMERLLIFLFLLIIAVYAGIVIAILQNRIDQSVVDDQLKQVLIVDGKLKTFQPLR